MVIPCLASLSDYTDALVGSNSLLYGAGFIGVLEGFVVARVFRASLWRSLLALIVANYVSMFAGVSLRHLVVPHFAFLTLDHALLSLAACAGGYLLLATLIEWPFLFFPLHQHRARAWQAIKGSALAQISSFVVLFGIYWMSSDVTLLFRTRPTHDFGFVKAPGAVAYYVNVADGHLWRRRLDGSPAEKVQDLPRHSADAILYAQPGADRKTFELWLSDTGAGKPATLVRADFAANPSLYPRKVGASPADGVRALNTNEPARLRERRGAQEWIASLDRGGVDGLQARNTVTEQTLQLAMETPFFSWRPRHAVMLPDNQLLVEFGPQLLVLDPEKRTVAVLARGTGPCVVLDEPAK